MNDLYKAIDALNNIVNEEPPRGRQDGPGLPKPAAPKINPAVPAGGPRRANPINPQAMAATKAAASVVNAPKPTTSMAMPKPKPAAPAPRAKVKATAANTKDFDKTMALQKRLQAQGYDIKADGIMGKNTRAAMAKAAQSARPEPTGTARKVSTVAPGADAEPKAFTPIAGAGDRKIGPTSGEIKIDRGNKALARDFKKIARGAGEIAAGGRAAGSGILDKIGAGISSLFKPSERSVIGKKQAAPAAAQAGPNAAGSNFATAADGSISRTDNPRQPGDAAPTTRTVRQRVTDPNEKAALIQQMNRARERQRLALAAGSTDPDDIRAYVNRMNKTQGTGAAGGTDMNTF